MNKTLIVVFLICLIPIFYSCKVLRYIVPIHTVEYVAVDTVMTNCGNVKLELIPGGFRSSFILEEFNGMNKIHPQNTIIKVDDVEVNYKVWVTYGGFFVKNKTFQGDTIKISEMPDLNLSYSFDMIPDSTDGKKFYIYSPAFMSSGKGTCGLGPYTIPHEMPDAK